MASFLRPSGGTKTEVKVSIPLAKQPLPEVVEPIPAPTKPSEMSWADRHAKTACMERARRRRPSAIVRQFETPDGVKLEFQELGKGTSILKAKNWKAMEEDLKPKPISRFLPVK